MTSALATTDVERAFFLYDQASPANVVATARLEGASEHSLKAGFERAAAAHPYLAFALSPDGLWLTPGDPPALTVQDGDVLDRELHTGFEPGAPLARAVLKRGPDHDELFVTLCHVVADGMSTIQLLRQTLEAAAGRPPSPRSLRRASAALFPASAPPPSEEAGSDGPQVLSQPPEETVSPAGARAERSVAVFRRWGTAQTAALTALARKTGVTVNALLTAALVQTMRERAGGWIQVSASIDLRRRLTAPAVEAADLGMWAGRCVLWADPGESGLTALASAYHARLAEYLRTCPFHGLHAFVNPPPPTGFFPHVKLTNMGDFGRHGFVGGYGFRVTSVQCLTPLHRGWRGQYGFGLIPSVFEGGLQFAVLFGNSAWSEDERREIADRLTSKLLQEVRLVG